MEKSDKKVVCTEDTQTFKIDLPCQLAERVEKYATENNSNIDSVVIEALDTFLKTRK